VLKNAEKWGQAKNEKWGQAGNFAPTGSRD
jgi:hypothetical protein